MPWVTFLMFAIYFINWIYIWMCWKFEYVRWDIRPLLSMLRMFNDLMLNIIRAWGKLFSSFFTALPSINMSNVLYSITQHSLPQFSYQAKHDYSNDKEMLLCIRPTLLSHSPTSNSGGTWTDRIATYKYTYRDEFSVQLN